MKQPKIKLGFPSGVLRERTIELFEKAGYEVNLQESLYKLNIDDPEIECLLARAQEITQNVEKGLMDAGITEKAFILDQKVEVIELADLSYGHTIWGNAKIVLAIPENSKIKSIKDLEGKKILSRVPEITKNYLRKHKIKAKVEWTDRPGEPKIPTFGDAVIEFTNTGEALKAHYLKVLDVLMETSPRLIANKNSWKNRWKREKIEDLAILLKGARLAQEYGGLMLHASNEMMEEVLKTLPALKRPTVTQLRGENWFDVLTVANKKEIREIIPKLKKIGCADIIEFPLNKVVI